jgi:AcrR family transcriptional regulator
MAPAAVRRSDAQRNRARLLAAARELLATDGVELSMREVARTATVGVGTLYRHFPTRDELVDAVLEDAFAGILASARGALDEDDAWTGLTGFIADALAQQACNRGLRDVIETRAHGRERAQAVREEVSAAIALLVARAQRQGTLRPDFRPDDVTPIFWACDRVAELGGAAWRRHLGFVLDGLRATPSERT